MNRRKKRLATSSLSLARSLLGKSEKLKNDLALLKVTSPKTEEPVASNSTLSQHPIFSALYFCRTSLRLGERAFFCTFALGFIILTDVWTHRDKFKKKSMKEDLNPSPATLSVITTGV